jgi:hypothetical protein
MVLNYGGGDLELSPQQIIRVSDNPALREQLGNDIITTDGTNMRKLMLANNDFRCLYMRAIRRCGTWLMFLAGSMAEKATSLTKHFAKPP